MLPKFRLHARPCGWGLKLQLQMYKPPNRWFTPALPKLKSARRHLEKLWLRTRSSHDLKLFRTATNSYHSAIIQAKKVFNSSLISSSSKNPRKLWNSINKLLHRKPMSQLPSNIESKSLSSMFASFFSDKVLKIHCALRILLVLYINMDLTCLAD